MKETYDILNRNAFEISICHVLLHFGKKNLMFPALFHNGALRTQRFGLFQR